MDFGNLISSFSVISKSSLYIWQFWDHILLKPSSKDFEHYLASMWNEYKKVPITGKILSQKKNIKSLHMVMDVQPNMLIILQYIQISLALFAHLKLIKWHLWTVPQTDRQTDGWIDTKAVSQEKKIKNRQGTGAERDGTTITASPFPVHSSAFA